MWKCILDSNTFKPICLPLCDDLTSVRKLDLNTDRKVEIFISPKSCVRRFILCIIMKTYFVRVKTKKVLETLVMKRDFQKHLLFRAPVYCWLQLSLIFWRHVMFFYFPVPDLWYMYFLVISGFLFLYKSSDNWFVGPYTPTVLKVKNFRNVFMSFSLFSLFVFIAEPIHPTVNTKKTQFCIC